MNETLFSAAYHSLCAELEAIYQSGEWKIVADDFHDYAAKRWGIPKKYVTLWRRFFKFCGMCREARVAVPEAPGVVEAILSRKQYRWLDLWRLCLQYSKGSVTPGHVSATLDRFAGADDKKPPQHVLDRLNAKRGLSALARVSDAENVKKFGDDTRQGVDMAITLDERRMNMESGR